ncbi:hypothetical protein K470DRAFT_264550 [Piedraia hortae CBS 480.64]|uniref:Uncharacterized protein n=1 Tax=Piedraia hortae CBS 480.64 TaxID=1314780 RepID=A0A6A7C003_9PEZI|nr:hypothetical protein K470DRAFT_264550 [Piedraia hortae CBS 480.64]
MPLIPIPSAEQPNDQAGHFIQPESSGSHHLLNTELDLPLYSHQLRSSCIILQDQDRKLNRTKQLVTIACKLYGLHRILLLLEGQSLPRPAIVSSNLDVIALICEFLAHRQGENPPIIPQQDTSEVGPVILRSDSCLVVCEEKDIPTNGALPVICFDTLLTEIENDSPIFCRCCKTTRATVFRLAAESQPTMPIPEDVRKKLLLAFDVLESDYSHNLPVDLGLIDLGLSTAYNRDENIFCA